MRNNIVRARVAYRTYVLKHSTNVFRSALNGRRTARRLNVDTTSCDSIFCLSHYSTRPRTKEDGEGIHQIFISGSILSTSDSYNHHSSRVRGWVGVGVGVRVRVRVRVGVAV